MKTDDSNFIVFYWENDKGIQRRRGRQSNQFTFNFIRQGRAGIRIGILLTFISFPNYNNVIAGHLTKSDTTTTDMSLRSTQLSASSQEFKFPTPGMLTDLNWKPITFSRSGLLWCLSRNSMSLDAGMFWVTIL